MHKKRFCTFKKKFYKIKLHWLLCKIRRVAQVDRQAGSFSLWVEVFPPTSFTELKRHFGILYTYPSSSLFLNYGGRVAFPEDHGVFGLILCITLVLVSYIFLVYLWKFICLFINLINFYALLMMLRGNVWNIREGFSSERFHFRYDCVKPSSNTCLVEIELKPRWGWIDLGSYCLKLFTRPLVSFIKSYRLDNGVSQIF